MTGSDRERDVRALAALLYEHREDALTCYDHPESYCCVCGEHEVGGYRGHLAAMLAEHDKAVAAKAWDEGRRTGASRAMRHMSDEPDLPLATAADNPYRDLARCTVTVYAGPPAPGRHATRPCGEPVALWGLCTRHLADHARLCDGGCPRCQ